MRILYCVLNWGLGHATRSVSVIRALQADGHEIEIASDGGPLELLQRTFPDCESHTLFPYNIHYPSRSVLINAITQSYKMFRAVSEERQQIETLVANRSFDAIVSDNRYGCHHPSIPSILVTHQLSNIAKTTIVNKPGEWIIHSYLKHFDEIWIPDTPDRVLTGKMTASTLSNLRFIGHLSDLERAPALRQYRIAAILSGPEPQRTKLEQEITPQLKTFTDTCCLARGLVSDAAILVEENLTIYPYLDRAGVQEVINSSDIIVCRTGYTSLMDLLHMGAKAILIPTPGQPEQEYLGERMKAYPQFVVQSQGRVDIDQGIAELRAKTIPAPPLQNTDLLIAAVKRLAERKRLH